MGVVRSWAEQLPLQRAGSPLEPRAPPLEVAEPSWLRSRWHSWRSGGPEAARETDSRRGPASVSVKATGSSAMTATQCVPHVGTGGCRRRPHDGLPGLPPWRHPSCRFCRDGSAVTPRAELTGGSRAHRPSGLAATPSFTSFRGLMRRSPELGRRSVAPSW
jgi:hypothetical protein